MYDTLMLPQSRGGGDVHVMFTDLSPGTALSNTGAEIGLTDTVDTIGRIVFRALQTFTLTFEAFVAATRTYPVNRVPGVSNGMDIVVRLVHGDDIAALALYHGESTTWYWYVLTDSGILKVTVTVSVVDDADILIASGQTA